MSSRPSIAVRRSPRSLGFVLLLAGLLAVTSLFGSSGSAFAATGSSEVAGSAGAQQTASQVAGVASATLRRAKIARPSRDGRRVRLVATPTVSAGGEFGCGLRSGGDLFCWGRNTYGQLGLGNTGPGPVLPTQVGRNGGWRQVSAGGSTTCAIRGNKSLWCWGLNHRGQIGDGSTTSISRPKQVRGTKNWASVSTGWFHTCGVRTNGSLQCWGDNSAGQLGKGSTQATRALVRVPGRNWASVSAAGWTTCATKRDGSLWCWGRNNFGQLGVGGLSDRSRPTRVGKSRTWRSVALSWTHACGTRRNGTVQCWGRNDQGQVGAGAQVYSQRPFTVPGNHRARSVAVSEGTSCLIDTAGKAWCWGDDRYGTLSASTSNNSTATPRALLGGRTFSSISGGWLHMCAQTGSGSMCWGNNERGQLGSAAVAAPKATPAKPTSNRRDGALRMRLATFNVLGNQHSRPYAHDDRFGPSRMRADWTAQAILNNNIQVAGIQEPDAGQVAGILAAGDGNLESYPGPEAGDLGVESTIVWDRRYFTAVEKTTLRTQFIARVLPRPIVKLKEIASGREFWVMDVHNAPQDQQKRRNKAVKVQLKKIRELEATGLPVFYVGDFNEKATIVCKVLRGTGLVSASGAGRLRPDGQCTTPKHMRVDWIFGSKATQWSGYVESKTPLGRLATDHWVPVVNVEVP